MPADRQQRGMLRPRNVSSRILYVSSSENVGIR